ncbi:hypothetical protein CPU12_06745 [Malaciobacter molluscorum LMG 25693]|uniref:Uncharacterized protein n=1 Tax=Malaciobacter molluscorum LMG 25693 TaxID=870501 RepID=A0A2G1DI25_9BACT|nr:hypothetical protein [Malaciobacter molluscorum]AXX92395.1 hypothetical protein AMOL_1420 [Malaciobacter molluscorum LMG 25693]PHO18158.1 hypothetical protein CPU12_06745 [Malaciobacter molluscorum LMG 25693]RXJ93947.1 hypothetical protein CRV00_08690 [Malaciobacter molluscorum]
MIANEIKNNIVSHLGENLVVSYYSTDNEIRDLIGKTINHIKIISEEDKEDIIESSLVDIRKRIDKNNIYS